MKTNWGITDASIDVPVFTEEQNNHVFLVDSGRFANATFGRSDVVNNSTPHIGWEYVTQGTGFVKEILVSNVKSYLTYSNSFINFVGNNTTPANGEVVVIGTNNVSIKLSATGAGYADLPSANGVGANNETLVFSLTPGGRVGRVHAECLVALSDPKPEVENSASPYFPG